MGRGLEKASVSGYSVALHCELRSTALVRTVELTSEKAVNEAKETLGRDAELRVAINKARQKEPLSGAELCILVAAIILGVP